MKFAKISDIERYSTFTHLCVFEVFEYNLYTYLLTNKFEPAV